MIKKIFSILFVFLFLFSFVGQVRADDLRKEAFCDPKKKEREQTTELGYKLCCKEGTKTSLGVRSQKKCGSGSIDKQNAQRFLTSGWLFYPTGCEGDLKESVNKQ
jgi:hypothetical protein